MAKKTVKDKKATKKKKQEKISETRGAEIGKLNCKACGLCCCTHSAFGTVAVTDDDYKRIPDGVKHVARKAISGYKIPADRDVGYGLCGCHFLSGEIMKLCTCDIYEQRPESCRVLDKGSAACLGIRKQRMIDK